MKIIILGVNKEPENYGGRAKEVDLIIEVICESVTLQIEDKVVAISRDEFNALQRLTAK